MVTREDVPAPAEPRPRDSGLRAGRVARHADPAFRLLVLGCGTMVLVVLAWMIVATASDAWPVFRQEGLEFFYGDEWDPGSSRREITGTYQVGPILWGTLLTSFIAVAFALPPAVGIALYLTQLAHPRLRGPLTYAVDLLAAVPSVVYGLWGSLWFIEFAHPIVAPLAAQIPVVGEVVRVRNVFYAGVVLGIMILPIISAVSREVIATVPAEERQAAFGLGATRWEVVRHVILPRARPGIIGATMLGLGRALGETIAVLLIIGGQARFGFQLFNTNQTIAGEIASAWKEASPEHQLGLIAAGVALFVLTVGVNLVARLVVSRMGRVGGDAAL